MNKKEIAIEELLNEVWFNLPDECKEIMIPIKKSYLDVIRAYAEGLKSNQIDISDEEINNIKWERIVERQTDFTNLEEFFWRWCDKRIYLSQFKEGFKAAIKHINK